ncbi:MAG: peptidoglycan-binding protein [Rhodospirillaceae bacterium]
MTPAVSPAAFALITSFEGCPPHPEWPGQTSGITLGRGSDIGADPAALEAWRSHLSPADFDLLAATRGRRGLAAKAVLPTVEHIVITRASADAVFAGFDMPRAAKATVAAFPGADILPADCFGALVSLVFNRGGDLIGPRRFEMSDIHELVTDPNSWHVIPDELAAMSRLWPDDDGPTASNLCGRRYAEAALFARGLRSKGLIEPRTLTITDRGTAVVALQKALGIPVCDGSFGPATLRYVIAHQTKNGLPINGLGDIATLRSLGLMNA